MSLETLAATVTVTVTRCRQVRLRVGLPVMVLGIGTSEPGLFPGPPGSDGLGTV